MWLVWLIHGAIAAVAVIASITDIRGRIVPNWLTLPALALGLCAFGLRSGGHGLLLSVGGAAVPVVVFGLPWLMGGFGGGDFKMALALGALGGPLFSLTALVWDLVWGLVLFAWWAAVRGRRGVWEPVPFAVALSGGALSALAGSLGGGAGARAVFVLACAGAVGAGGYAVLRYWRRRGGAAGVAASAHGAGRSAPTPPRKERNSCSSPS